MNAFKRPDWIPHVRDDMRILITGGTGGLGRALVKMLTEGSDCKIGVHGGSQKFKSDDPEVPNAEQLWVEILLVQNSNKILGQLDDNPKYIQDLKCGEIIEFEERHIIDTG